MPAEVLEKEQAKTRKLEIVFGPWWRHYAVPYELKWTLYSECTTCPYCGGALGSMPGDKTSADAGATAHLDHMDPISKGGEDSIRNAIYVCATCNITKRNRLFTAWLEMIKPERQSVVRLIYENKHGHPPEAFVPGPRQVRLTMPRIELQLEEVVLRRLFRKPIVSGPPKREASI